MLMKECESYSNVNYRSTLIYISLLLDWLLSLDLRIWNKATRSHLLYFLFGSSIICSSIWKFEILDANRLLILIYPVITDLLYLSSVDPTPEQNKDVNGWNIESNLNGYNYFYINLVIFDSNPTEI
jgi:hypothetical protein